MIVNAELALRAGALVAAAALLAAPHWGTIRGWLAKTIKAAKPSAAVASRIAAICLLIVGVGYMPSSVTVTPHGVITLVKVMVGIGFVWQAICETVSLIRPVIKVSP